MKTIKSTLVLLAGILIINACQKDSSIESASAPTSVAVVKPVAQKMSDLAIKSSFDWRTTKTYQFTFTGNVKDYVSIVSVDGSIYHTALLTPQSLYKITLTLPTYETKVHFVYNNTDIEFPLSGTTVNYTFK